MPWILSNGLRAYLILRNSTGYLHDAKLKENYARQQIHNQKDDSART
jgi:hypothetical protein